MPNKMNVLAIEINRLSVNDEDYISITDVAKAKTTGTSDDIIKIGSETEIRSSFSVFGNNSTILILNPSNSTGLKNKPV